MPRGQKNKCHFYQKCQQTRDKAESSKILEDATTTDEEALSSPFFLLEANTQNSSATETTSTYQVSERASTTTLNSSAFYAISENSQDKEYSCCCEVLYPENSFSDPLNMNVILLEQYLLYKYKVNQPILREDMLNIVSEKYHNRFAEILKKASEHIEVVFGVDLKEIDSPRHSYDLVSKLQLPYNGRVHPGRGLPKTGLLMNILGAIILNGNRAAEEEIWELLNMMKVYAGEKHFIYGEPRKLITHDLVKLKYLEYRQVPYTEPPRYEFRWGSKAYAETSKMKVLEFLAKLNNTVPSDFSSVYQQALEEEEEREQARGAAGAGTTIGRDDSMATSMNDSTTSEF